MTSSADDARIDLLTSAARRTCELIGKQVFVLTTFKYVLDAFPSADAFLSRDLRGFFATFGGLGSSIGFPAQNEPSISLPRSPLVAVSSITYLDASGTRVTLSPTLYRVLPGPLGKVAPAVGQSWPIAAAAEGAIEITFTAGRANRAAVPANAKAAVLLALAHVFENAETPAPIETIQNLLSPDEGE